MAGWYRTERNSTGLLATGMSDPVACHRAVSLCHYFAAFGLAASVDAGDRSMARLESAADSGHRAINAVLIKADVFNKKLQTPSVPDLPRRLWLSLLAARSYKNTIYNDRL